MKFCTTPITVGPTLDLPEHLVEAAPNLSGCSLTHAALFGGPLIRKALEQCPLSGDRTHITVDSKVSAFFFPNSYALAPGWHTDGTPFVNGQASLRNQLELTHLTLAHLAHHRVLFHSIAVGLHAPMRFLNGPVDIDLSTYDTQDMWTELDARVESFLPDGDDSLVQTPPNNAWVSWDWWTLHQASPCSERGHRLLLRVRESDLPQHAPREKDWLQPYATVWVKDTKTGSTRKML